MVILRKQGTVAFLRLYQKKTIYPLTVFQCIFRAQAKIILNINIMPRINPTTLIRSN